VGKKPRIMPAHGKGKRKLLLIKRKLPNKIMFKEAAHYFGILLTAA
jgi:hypothetical protein